MDEDAPSETEIAEYNEAEEDVVRQKINNETKKNNNYSYRTRIDQLSTPNKRFILALYQEHAKHFPKSKVERIKDNLQQLYAMSPEETEKYFEELKRQSEFMEVRRKLKRKLRKELRKLRRAKQQARAFEFIQKLLKMGMEFAFNNPIPPLVSVRLRNLSDIVLEQICDLRNIDHPNREDPDKVGIFLIAVADWIAIIIEHIYFEVQLKKNRELDELDKQKDEQLRVGSEVPRASPTFTKSDDGTADTDNIEEMMVDNVEGGDTSDMVLDQNFE